MDTSRHGSPAFSGWRHGAVAILATTLLGLALVPPAVAGDNSPAGPRADVQARTDDGHEIDTSDKRAVAEAWRQRMASNTDVPSGWTGSVDGCKAGHPSSDAQEATLESVNFARAMAGLDAVDLDGSLSRKAQKAALIMTANDALSHDPPKDWRCWSKTGSDAAGRSNLAWTSGQLTAGESIELYLDDPGPGNRAAGHRRWVLNPFATAIGNGLTNTADALYVLGPTDSTATNPDWVPWPTAGWFPSPLQPRGRWSLSSGVAGADFSHATVRVTRGSDALPVTRYKTHDGYAQPTLVFQVGDARRTGSYRVVVRHIRGAATARHAWTVRLFKP
ncbi:MAG: hypothetical protein JWO76_1132 [Nocardioides sp.]|nr:hypothetical protein [Nocardioides sp.]